ncbi:SAV_6107 family HEPN domain-containing protein [Amycolatopsis benzoatilytica]|uniref:SAV_6107 family HEPN domain-containing protein n=1 Tax=Amycolatopsis benzoatilytica TaxID=346045 RepID=UPI000381EFF2|nr:SAV_6107 family HEPN domain-containing protein [Amycolatopsis benzoatilytica]
MSVSAVFPAGRASEGGPVLGRSPVPSEGTAEQLSFAVPEEPSGEASSEVPVQLAFEPASQPVADAKLAAAPQAAAPQAAAPQAAGAAPQAAGAAPHAAAAAPHAAAPQAAGAAPHAAAPQAAGAAPHAAAAAPSPRQILHRRRTDDPTRRTISAKPPVRHVPASRSDVDQSSSAQRRPHESRRAMDRSPVPSAAHRTSRLPSTGASATRSFRQPQLPLAEPAADQLPEAVRPAAAVDSATRRSSAESGQPWLPLAESSAHRLPDAVRPPVAAAEPAGRRSGNSVESRLSQPEHQLPADIRTPVAATESAARPGDPSQSQLPLSLRPPAPPAAEALLAQAKRGLDQASKERDPAECFIGAYLAALRGAAAVLAVRGRPRRGRGRPASGWVLLDAVAPELREWSAFFAANSETRAAAEAGITGRVTAELASGLLQATAQFLELVRRVVHGQPISGKAHVA